jgi:hypothetical protein
MVLKPPARTVDGDKGDFSEMAGQVALSAPRQAAKEGEDEKEVEELFAAIYTKNGDHCRQNWTFQDRHGKIAK